MGSLISRPVNSIRQKAPAAVTKQPLAKPSSLDVQEMAVNQQLERNLYAAKVPDHFQTVSVGINPVSPELNRVYYENYYCESSCALMFI